MKRYVFFTLKRFIPFFVITAAIFFVISTTMFVNVPVQYEYYVDEGMVRGDYGFRAMLL